MKTWADFGIVVAVSSGECDTQCPKCSPQRKKKNAKCLSVNASKGSWLCHHCGWAGGLDEGERRIDVGWAKPKFREPSPPAERPLSTLEAWAASRSLTMEVLKRNGVISTVVYMPQLEDSVPVVAFPYYRGTTLVNVKYRDREKNFRMEAGAERILYGLNDIKPESCLIVEGEVDKLSCEVAGFANCLSVPDGAPSPESKNYASKFSFLEADEALLNPVQEWILALDNDGPGKRLETELSRRLGREKCKRVNWPDGCKDANDVLIQFGADRLAECIANAELYPIDGVFALQDISARVVHLFEHGWDRPVSTGWEELDKFYRVRPGEFTVVTGIPGSGKSNFIDALTINLARLHGWRTMIFSPENQPIEDHVARMVEKRLDLPFFEGPTPRMSAGQMQVAMEWVMEHVYWYLPPEEGEWTIDNILNAAKQLVRQKGIQGLVIDPWNELECSRPRDLTETEFISGVLKRVRQFARRYAVHVWIVAHPTKLSRGEDGNYPVPTMYDIAGSSHWRNKADNGLCVWRDFAEDGTPIKVFIQKIRFRQNGGLGMVRFDYRPATATYHECSALPNWGRG